MRETSLIFQVAAYESALKHAAHGRVEEAREGLQSVLEDPLVLNAAACTAPCGGADGTPRPAAPSAVPEATSKVAKAGLGPGPAFLQLKYLSLRNLAALEGDYHNEVCEDGPELMGGIAGKI